MPPAKTIGKKIAVFSRTKNRLIENETELSLYLTQILKAEVTFVRMEELSFEEQVFRSWKLFKLHNLMIFRI